MVKEEFVNFIEQNRIPVRVVLQLTYVCNFRCVHCYQTPIKEKANDFLSAQEWRPLLIELRKRGCMFLSLTGGEIFSYPDFFELYRIAYELGFKISLSTNGSLIRQEHIRFLKKYRPEKVCITLYGMSQETYGKFCKNQNAFPIVQQNAILLKHLGIKVIIKYITTKINSMDLVDAASFAHENKMEFYQYYKIRSFLDGNCQPQELQLSAAELLEVQSAFEFDAIVSRVQNKKEKWARGYKNCTAGLTNMEFDPSGNAFLCDMIPSERFSIKKYSFDEIWRRIYDQRKNYIERHSACSDCSKRETCGICAPCNLMEYGSYDAVPSRVCDLTNDLICLVMESERNEVKGNNISNKHE